MRYDPGDTPVLPAANAEILIDQGKAQLDDTDKTDDTDELEDDLQRKILDKIAHLDQTDDKEGVSYSELVLNLDAFDDADDLTDSDAVKTLLSDGHCYEPEPGRIQPL